MTKRSLFLIVAILLFGCYIYLFSDWFKPRRIQIIQQLRPQIPGTGGTYPVSFMLDGDYKLTSIKVVPLAGPETNKNAVPAWHLISKSNSVPTRGFLYGTPIDGMASCSNQPVQPLGPDIPYRLLIEAGKAQGSVDFQTREIPEESQ